MLFATNFFLFFFSKISQKKFCFSDQYANVEFNLTFVTGDRATITVQPSDSLNSTIADIVASCESSLHSGCPGVIILANDEPNSTGSLEVMPSIY